MTDPATKLVVQLTVEELRALVREAVVANAGNASPPWVDVETAANHAGVTPKTLRMWIAGGLPASNLGRDYRLRIADLDAWIEAHRVGKLVRVK